MIFFNTSDATVFFAVSMVFLSEKVIFNFSFFIKLRLQLLYINFTAFFFKSKKIVFFAILEKI